MYLAKTLKSKQDLILKTPNIITCGELIKILKSNNKVMNKYYKISSIFFKIEKNMF